MTPWVPIQAGRHGQATAEWIATPSPGSTYATLDRPPAQRTLTMFKEQLLQNRLPGGIDAEQTRLLRLAAGEAEALAWLTPFPHLLLPVLLEEKLNAVRKYVTHQERMRIHR